MIRFRLLFLSSATAVLAAGLLLAAGHGSDSTASAATQPPSVGGSSGYTSSGTYTSSGQANHPAAVSEQSAVFHDQMRKLWEDHITWTRLFIVSAVAGLPDLPATTDRLLQNQSDIGAAVKPFYGDAAGNQLTSLLKTHITTAAEILTAAKAGDAAATKAASDRWYANADDIAAFLNGANPQNWQLQEMRRMMREHLDLTLAEATAQLTGDYPASVDAYDKIHVQILGMADMLSAGIMAQFPHKIR